MSSRTTEEKRQKGIYYTPNEATKILCDWAIREADARLLEPSFGACGFLEASSKRLSELGSTDPCLQLYGCDVDERAFDAHLWPIFNERDELLNQFHIEDFLAMKPGAWNTDFDVVIGNPPYISHHRMSETQKANLRKAFVNSPWPLDKRADLWAYFVLHSLHFLRVGGRVAWILPGSFLHSDYAARVRAVIGEKFGKALGIQLGQKLFVAEGAQENTIVLLADGYGESGDGLRVQFAETLEDLTRTIASWDDGQPTGQLCGERVQEAFLPVAVRETIGAIERDFEVKSLGDFCAIRIGIVTGCNPFFVFNQEKAALHDLPSDFLCPILPKFDMVGGMAFTTADLDFSVANGVNCLLLDTKNWEERPDDAVGLYLSSFDEAAKTKNKTFQKRGLWHQPNDGMTPCAFLSYMHEHGPRLALNEARTTSTNTVHRVFFPLPFGFDGSKGSCYRFAKHFWSIVRGNRGEGLRFRCPQTRA